MHLAECIVQWSETREARTRGITLHAHRVSGTDDASAKSDGTEGIAGSSTSICPCSSDAELLSGSCTTLPAGALFRECEGVLKTGVDVVCFASSSSWLFSPPIGTQLNSPSWLASPPIADQQETGKTHRQLDVEESQTETTPATQNEQCRQKDRTRTSSEDTQLCIACEMCTDMNSNGELESSRVHKHRKEIILPPTLHHGSAPIATLKVSHSSSLVSLACSPLALPPS